MINHKHKFILILLPKTGTTSLLNLDFVNPEYWRHPYTGVQRHYDLIDNSQMDYYKACTCRNPYTKCVSLWAYWNRRLVNKGENAFEFSTFVSNFDNIKQRVMQHFTVPESIHFNGCCESVEISTHGKLSYNDIDHWIKLENFQSDLNVLCDKIGIPHQQLPHTNQTKHKHYTEYYDDETKQIVADRFAKDIEYFGYEFGE